MGKILSGNRVPGTEANPLIMSYCGRQSGCLLCLNWPLGIHFQCQLWNIGLTCAVLEVQNSAVFCHSNTLLKTLNPKPSFGEYFARRLSRKLTHRQFHVPGGVALFVLLKFTCNSPLPVSRLISNLTLWCGESAGSSVSYPSITRFLLFCA